MSINRITSKNYNVVCKNLYINDEFNINIDNALISQVYKNDGGIEGWYDQDDAISINGFKSCELIFNDFTFAPGQDQLIPFNDAPIYNNDFFEIDNGLLTIIEDGVYMFSCSITVNTTSSNQCANMRLRRNNIDSTDMVNEGNAMSYTSIVPVYNLVDTTNHNLYGEWTVVVSKQERNIFAMYGSSTNTASINLILNNCSFDIVKIS